MQCLFCQLACKVTNSYFEARWWQFNRRNDFRLFRTARNAPLLGQRYLRTAHRKNLSVSFYAGSLGVSLSFAHVSTTAWFPSLIAELNLCVARELYYSSASLRRIEDRKVLCSPSQHASVRQHHMCQSVLIKSSTNTLRFCFGRYNAQTSHIAV